MALCGALLLTGCSGPKYKTRAYVADFVYEHKIESFDVSPQPATPTNLSAIDLCRRGYLPLSMASFTQAPDITPDSRRQLLDFAGRFGELIQLLHVNRKDVLRETSYSGGGPITWRSSDGIMTYERQGTLKSTKTTSEYEAVGSSGILWRHWPEGRDYAKKLIERNFYGQTEEEQAKLLEAYANHRVGFIDKTGKVAIPATFEAAWPFREGLAKVRIDGKHGFIDKTGRLVIPARFDNVQSFSEGVAWFSVLVPPSKKRSEWVGEHTHGLIDRRGEVVIPPGRFVDALPFSEGLAGASVWEGDFRPVRRHGFIDKKGEWVLPPQYVEVQPFSEGRAFVEVKYLDHRFIDKSGKQIPGGPYYEGNPFSGGLAFVKLHEQNRKSYIDRSGRVIFPLDPYFSGICSADFSNGRLRVRGEKGGFLYVDERGRPFPWKKYWKAGPFSEERAWVMVDGKIGFIDLEGRLVIRPQFERAGSFSEGLAPVMVSGKVGLIDKSGEMVIAPAFSSVGSFSEGLAAFVPSAEK